MDTITPKPPVPSPTLPGDQNNNGNNEAVKNQTADVSKPLKIKKSAGEFGKAFKWGSGLSFGCFLFIFFAVASIVIFSALTDDSNEPESTNKIVETQTQGTGRDKIAVINIAGEIIESSSALDMSNGVVSTIVSNELKKAHEDKNVKAVVLSVNSPGGGVNPSFEIYKWVKALKLNNKPVVVSMGDMAASGGYLLSAPADKIYALPTTWTGSIGVIMSLPNYEGLFEKIGYKEIVIKSGKLKDMGSSSRALSDEEKAVFQNMIDDAYDQFVTIVAEGRGKDKAEIKKIADGRIYSGKQAKENGLVDELGGLDDAIKEAANLSHITDYTVVEYSRPVSLSEKFLQFKTNLNFLGVNLDLRKAQDAKPSLKYKWSIN